ncbi:MAG: thioredoxin domain-containing protein, partial [candidate division WOR-3 bacterium]
DEIYVEAVRLMTGTAGWPLSVFLTPELKPFYGGTYFPPLERHGLPAFERVLTSVLHYFRTERHEIDEASNRVTAELNRLSMLTPEQGALDDTPLRRFYKQRFEVFDSEHGGFGVAPKFPNPTDLSLLLRLSSRPGFDQARAMAELTLKKMADGGICDQLGGGFHRYSTDTVWLIPHFEKMLYDNALLAQVYLQAFRLTRDQFYKVVAEQTLDYIKQELASERGGFCSSQDADIAGAEGGYYTWTESELRQAVGPDLFGLAADYYGVSRSGVMGGASVLHVSTPVEVLMQRHRLGLNELWQRLAAIKSKLLLYRALRSAPHRDTKVLADWNGLAISAFSHAARTLEKSCYLDVACQTADFLLSEYAPDGDLLHFRRAPLPDIPGQLPDFALVAQGLLDLFDASHEPHYLEAASRLTDRMLELFSAPEGGFYTTRPGDRSLITRVMNGFDGAVPSGNSIAVLNLLRLARLTGSNEYERVAALTLRRFYPTMLNYPAGISRMLSGLDFLLNPGKEIVLFIPEPGPESRAMVRVIEDAVDDNATAVVISAAEPDPATVRLIPLTRNRRALNGRPTAYVCSGFTCHEPVFDAESLRLLLSQEPPEPKSGL